MTPKQREAIERHDAKRTFPCECFDQACPVHLGAACNKHGQQILIRVDMTDETGTRFCDACAEDAYESGLFREEK